MKHLYNLPHDAELVPIKFADDLKACGDRAAQMVKEHWDAIHRVAKVLEKNGDLTDAEIRELIAEPDGIAQAMVPDGDKLVECPRVGNNPGTRAAWCPSSPMAARNQMGGP